MQPTAVSFMPQTVQSFTPESVDLSHLRQRQALADALLQSANTPISTQRQSGRFVSAISPFEGVTKLVQAYLGAKQHQNIEQETRDLASDRVKRMAAFFADPVATPPSEAPSETLGAPYNAEAYDTKTPNPYNVPGASTPQWMDLSRPASGIQANAVEVRGKVPQEAPQPAAAPDPLAQLRTMYRQAIAQGMSPELAMQGYMQAQQKVLEQQIKQPEYEYKQDENGNYVALPKHGGAPVNTGVRGGGEPKGYTAGGVRYDGQNRPVAGQVERLEGNKKVTYEVRGGQLVKIAEGPAFNPNPLIQMGGEIIPVSDPNSPTGSRYIRKTDAVGQPAPATGANKPSDAERLAKGFHDRMVAAEKLLTDVGDKGYPTEFTSAAGSLPFVGDYAKRKASSPEQQKYQQAQEDWVRSKLRKESGAAIGEKEMADEIRTYFPQPGDGPEVIAQKAQARQVAIQAMRDAGGPAIGNVPAGQPQKAGKLTADEQRELMELKKRFGK